MARPVPLMLRWLGALVLVVSYFWCNGQSVYNAMEAILLNNTFRSYQIGATSIHTKNFQILTSIGAGNGLFSVMRCLTAEDLDRKVASIDKSEVPKDVEQQSTSPKKEKQAQLWR